MMFTFGQKRTFQAIGLLCSKADATLVKQRVRCDEQTLDLHKRSATTRRGYW
jgi:hypothetical protein